MTPAISFKKPIVFIILCVVTIKQGDSTYQTKLLSEGIVWVHCQVRLLLNLLG